MVSNIQDFESRRPGECGRQQPCSTMGTSDKSSIYTRVLINFPVSWKSKLQLYNTTELSMNLTKIIWKGPKLYFPYELQTILKHFLSWIAIYLKTRFQVIKLNLTRQNQSFRCLFVVFVRNHVKHSVAFFKKKIGCFYKSSKKVKWV